MKRKYQEKQEHLQWPTQILENLAKRHSWKYLFEVRETAREHVKNCDCRTSKIFSRLCKFRIGWMGLKTSYS